MIIYIVRHGETDANKNLILQGSIIDFPLNETGNNQLKNSGIEFKKNVNHIDYAFSSHLQRAKESANILLNSINSNVTLNIDDRIIERDYGSYDGTNIKEYRKLKELGLTDESQYESDSLLKERVSEFLESLNNLENNSKVLVVSHSQTIKTFYLISGSLKGGYLNSYINNGSISIFDYNENKLTFKEYIDVNEITLRQPPIKFDI